MNVKLVRTAALLVLVAAVATLAGCGRRGLIRVNGEKIPKEDFYVRLERVPVQTPQGAKPAGRYVIEQMINEKLVEQLAADKKVAPTETQINGKIEFMKKQSGGDFRRALAMRGMTLEDLKRQVALQQSIVNLVTRNVKVADAEVRAAYDKALKEENSPFKRPEQVFISAIAAKTKDKIDKAYQMLKGGQEFTAVAMRMSEMPNAKESMGRLDWVARSDKRVPPEAIKAIFALNLGSYTAPLKFGNEFVILRADQRRPEKTTKFEEVKDVLKEQLAMAKAEKNNPFQKDMLAFAKKSDIQVNAERYKDIPETLKKQISMPPVATGTAAPGAAAP